MTTKPKFEIYRDGANEYRWRLVTHNGRIVADSGEGYSRKDTAKHAATQLATRAYDALASLDGKAAKP